MILQVLFYLNADIVDKKQSTDIIPLSTNLFSTEQTKTDLNKTLGVLRWLLCHQSTITVIRCYFLKAFLRRGLYHDIALHTTPYRHVTRDRAIN